MEFIAFFLINVVKILKYAILVRVLMSWVQTGNANPGKLGQILYDMTEPTLRMFRRILPRTGMIDFSPLLAFIALDLVEVLLISLFSRF